MKIIILGKGYIGSAISDYLKSNTEYSVFHISQKDCNYLNFTKDNFLWSFLQSEDIIINCVGYTGEPNIDSCKLLQNQSINQILNIDLPVFLQNICIKRKCYLIHISTGCLFNNGTFSEEDNYTSIDHPYYNAKITAEQQLAQSVILRPRFPFDQRKHKKNFLQKILNFTTLVESLNSKTYLPDMSRFITSLIDLDCVKYPVIYNVCCKNPLSMREITDIIGKDYSWSDNLIERNECILDVSRADSICNLSDEREAIMQSLYHLQ